jgi:hypothetical protein
LKPILSIEEILQRTEYHGYEETNSALLHYGTVLKLCVIIFMRPSSKVTKEEIIPSLRYFHYRAKPNVRFYFPGYLDEDEYVYHSIKYSYEFIGPEEKKWYFYDKEFNESRKFMEDLTEWRYSGGSDVIIANAGYSNLCSSAFRFLDIDNAMFINLDKLGSNKIGWNTERLFESIFKYCEDQNENNPVWGFSDVVGKTQAKEALWKLLLSIIPASIKDTFDLLRMFSVKKLKVSREQFHTFEIIRRAINFDAKEDVIKLLKGEIDIVDNDGLTPLMIATQIGRFEIVEWLIRNGANMNVKDDLGFTALHHAIDKKQSEIASYLSDNGSEINSKDIYGNTALDIAILNGGKERLEFAKILKSRGSEMRMDPNKLTYDKELIEILKN